MNVVNLMAFVLFKDKNNNFIEFTIINPTLPYIVTYNTQFMRVSSHFSAILIKYGTENRWFLSNEQSIRFIDMYSLKEIASKLKCPYDLNEEVFYNNKKYFVDERVFDKNQNCIALNLKDGEPKN